MLNQSDSAYLNHRKRLLAIHTSPGKIKKDIIVDHSYVEAKRIKDETRIYNMKSSFFHF